MKLSRLTRDEPERFTAAFNFLSTSKNAKHDDVKLEASFLVLGDLPIASVEIAAKTLSKEANPFMPDDGSWYEIADTHAALQLAQSTEQTHYLSTAHVEEDEKSRTLKARRLFVEKYEQYVGRKLPDDHVWKSDSVSVVTHHCNLCCDMGWRSHTCTTDNLCSSCVLKKTHIYDHDYVERCLCFRTNPLFEARRARSQLSSRGRSNRR
tara:strand:+ start:60 stop:683 length:624 start_codon:yes stop_codon:yes gene_type:complete